MTTPANEPNEGGRSSAVEIAELLTNLERLNRTLGALNRTLKTLSAGNHTLLHAANEQELLHDMCEVIVEKGGYRLAVVAYAQRDEEKTIRWMASVGVDPAFLDAAHYTWADTELGRT